ncbi:DMT family transporter [Xanthobacter agilis]|uniref:Small multidrug resistance pump n=1 Tax=Xanthobacter agilis TaxID=47492 RepID=A0ABU0LGI4_XANAG|nr:multidrug efflux SMR transporter [Xanthobacter agilis]MDQ0506261.1 small multidrug resistance pump [Xanthobacter agilis]
MSYLYLAVAIVAEVIATSALKSTDGFTRLVPSLVVGFGYVVAFYCLSVTVRELPVGVVYAIWSAVGIVLVAAFAWIYLGQALDWPAIVGLGLIVVGVVVVNLFSKTVAH